MKKKAFIFLYFFSVIIVLFLISDLILSKYTNLFKIRKDCFNYIKIKKDNKDFYTYNLKKNCFAFEHKGKTPSYKVFTNNNGHRFSNKKSFKSENKIIFLGDSFTYGFGVSYDESIPGQISQKVGSKYDILNFGVPGYSPSINLFKLKEYIKDNQNIKITKIFYLLDLTDVHDESNRWIKIPGIKQPVIVNENLKKEIKKKFFIKNSFRTSRYVAYILNNSVRNLKKKIIASYTTKQNIIDEKGTYWGSFTHTSQKKLYEDKQFSNIWKKNYKLGLDLIEKKIINISKLSDNLNAEFYIVIHPWKESIELGQNEFNWEKYSNRLCALSKCTKLINFFDDVKQIKNNNLNWKTKLYFYKDIHFNKEGNKLYAEKIFIEAF
jgi:hypothetical protein